MVERRSSVKDGNHGGDLARALCLLETAGFAAWWLSEVVRELSDRGIATEPWRKVQHRQIEDEKTWEPIVVGKGWVVELEAEGF